MKIQNPLLRKLLGRLWYSFAALLVLAALLLTAARVSLPYVEDYQKEIEALVNERSKQPVRIGKMEAEWRGFTPYLVFSDIDLLDNKSEKTLIHFEGASIGVHLWRSLYQRQLEMSDLTVKGLKLNITRYRDGHIEISGLSQKVSGADSTESEAIASWLFTQQDIGIEDSQLAWTDKLSRRGTLKFTGVQLRLQNDNDKHILQGDIILPKKYGKSLAFVLDIKGDVLDPRDWTGSLYVKGRKLLPQSIEGPVTLADLTLRSALIDAELWTKWDKSKLQSLKGSVQLDKVNLRTGKQASELKNLKFDLDWARNNQGWIMRANDINISAAREWPATQLVVKKKHVDREYDLQLSFLRLQDILPIVVASGVLEDRTAQLRTMQPAGDLHDIRIRSKKGGDFSIASRLQGIAVNAWQDIPGIENLSGQLSGTAAKGSFDISSNKVAINAPGIFRSKLIFDEFNAKLGWTRDDTGYHVDAPSIKLSNADVSSEGHMRLDIPADGSSPFIDLVSSLKGQNGENASAYLPARKLSKSVVNWLDNAVKAGTVPEGGMVLRGPLDKFPFYENDGRFEIGFKVVNGVLNYKQGWPMIHGIEADVLFDGPGLLIKSNKGKILGTQLKNVEVRIPDLINGVLSFEGKTFGTTSDALEFVLKSRIAGKRQKGLQQLQASGNTSIQLAANIPLRGTEDNKIEGMFTFEESAISLKNSKHSLVNVNGKVSFKDSDFSARDIKGVVFGKPLVIDVDSHIKGSETLPDAAIRIRGRGKMDLNALLQSMVDEHIPVFVSGKDRWQMTLRIPENPDDDSRWSISSRLIDSVIALPAPFNKEKGESRFLKLAGTLPQENIMKLWLHYGTIVNGAVSVDTKSHFVPRNGELHFGDIPATLPDKAGVVVRGSIKKASIDAWQNWFGSHISTKSPGGDFLPVRDVDITFGQLQYGEHSLNNVHINGSKDASYWNFVTESDRLSGNISIPHLKGQLPVKVNLEKLKLPKTTKSEQKTLADPRKLPALDMQVADFSYDDRNFGELSFVLVPQLQGSFIKKFRLDSPSLEIDATGDWQIDDKQEQVTRLNAKLRSEDLGGLLKDLGFAGTIKSGRSKAFAQLQWPGGPVDFSVNALVGTMDIDIRKGQIVDVEPGAGRVFGLLSLATLPRRLTLDFSDLFSKGFSFDVIKGGFTFENGDAYTSNLYLEGPAARIDALGRIGLKNEDYDQLVTVTPKLTASLPVAGALVGGPVAGGVLFAVEKFFGRSIDEISQYQYSMTGSWDEPVVTKLEKEQKEQDEDSQESQSAQQP